MNQSADSVQAYLAQQAGLKQELQKQIALEAGKAQMDAWSKMQDPIARALTMGKLGEMGFPVGQMNGMSMPSMSDMLAGNPYAKYVLPQGGQGFGGFTPPQPQSPQGGSPQGSYSPQVIGLPSGQTGVSAPDNMLGTSQPSDTSGGWLATTAERNPFGGYMAKEIQNVPAQTQIAAGKSYAEKIGLSKAQQTTGTTMLDSITRNLAADLKAHFIESSGGGPVKGNITGFSTKFGMSPATYGLQNTVRDSAIAYARDLAGGSQGVQRLFQAIGETIPQVGTSQDQAGTALLQMHLTAAQLQSGIQNLGIQPQDLSKMSEQEIQQVLAKGSIDRDAETQRFSQMIAGIKPTKVMGMDGQYRDPTVNPLLSMFGSIKNEGKLPGGNPFSQTSGNKSIPKYDRKTQKLQQNKNTGEYRVVSL